MNTQTLARQSKLSDEERERERAKVRSKLYRKMEGRMKQVNHSSNISQHLLNLNKL